MTGLSAVVASNVRDLLPQAGKRQVDVAAALGISQPAVSARLKGVTPFTIDELAPLAELLGVDTSDLLGGAA